jgi:uncharacterized protein YlzI (FlbEa/FlbD family)
MQRIIFLFFLCPSAYAVAQTETQIREHYTSINKQIAESIEHGFEGLLYQNQLVINKNGRSWPAVGNYADTVNFWYDDNPSHISATERNPKTVLLKINISRKASHLMSKEEYLYKNGKLLFYFSHEGEEGNEWETRIYFNTKGLMFKSSVKANGKELTAKDFLSEDYKDFKPNAAATMANGKKFQDLFVKSM